MERNEKVAVCFKLMAESTTYRLLSTCMAIFLSLSIMMRWAMNLDYQMNEKLF